MSCEVKSDLEVTPTRLTAMIARGIGLFEWTKPINVFVIKDGIPLNDMDTLPGANGNTLFLKSKFPLVMVDGVLHIDLHECKSEQDLELALRVCVVDGEKYHTLYKLYEPKKGLEVLDKLRADKLLPFNEYTIPVRMHEEIETAIIHYLKSGDYNMMCHPKSGILLI